MLEKFSTYQTANCTLKLSIGRNRLAIATKVGQHSPSTAHRLND